MSIINGFYEYILKPYLIKFGTGFVAICIVALLIYLLVDRKR